MKLKVGDKIRHHKESRQELWEIMDIKNGRMSLKRLKGLLTDVIPIGQIIHGESPNYYNKVDESNHPYTKIFK